MAESLWYHHKATNNTSTLVFISGCVSPFHGRQSWEFPPSINNVMNAVGSAWTQKHVLLWDTTLSIKDHAAPEALDIWTAHQIFYEGKPEKWATQRLHIFFFCAALLSSSKVISNPRMHELMAFMFLFHIS